MYSNSTHATISEGLDSEHIERREVDHVLNTKKLWTSINNELPGLGLPDEGLKKMFFRKKKPLRFSIEVIDWVMK